MPEPTSADTRLARFGPFIAAAGVLGLGAIAILALLHLGADLAEILGAMQREGVLRAVGVTIVVMAVAVLGVILIARLAAGDRLRVRAAYVIGVVLLVGVRVVVAAVYEGVGDGELRQYDSLARDVLAGTCCFADRPMGYPILLAVAYGLLGPGNLAVELLNIGFALGTGALVAALGARLYGARVGVVALLLYALWPAGALMIVTSLPHTSYELAVIAAAWAAVAVAPGWRGSALTGAVLGFSQYLRPTAPLLLAVYLLARVWPGSTLRRFVTGTLVPMVGVFLLVLVPVANHNLAAHGQLSISTSAYGGHGLWIGTDPRTDGRYSTRAAEEVLALEGRDFWDKSDRAGELAVARILADPLGILAMGIRKQDPLWGTERYGIQYAIGRARTDEPAKPANMLPSVASGAFWLLVSATAAAALLLRRRRVDALMVLVVGLVLSVSAAHALLEVRDRYHAYVVPLLLPLAAVALVALLERLRVLPPNGSPATTGAPSDAMGVPDVS